MPSKNKRILPARACSWNVLSGNVSNPSFMRVPLVTNTGRLPLVTGGLPFSLAGGTMHSWKQTGEKRANPGRRDNISEIDKPGVSKIADPSPQKDRICPWCGGDKIRPELKAGKRALWGCLDCNRRWWASAADPKKTTRQRPRLRMQVYQGTFWKRLGGIGW